MAENNNQKMAQSDIHNWFNLQYPLNKGYYIQASRDSVDSPNWVATQIGKANQIAKNNFKSTKPKQLSYTDVSKMSLPIQATYSITQKDESSASNKVKALNDFLKRTPIARTINHSLQTYANQIPKIMSEGYKGNYGKAILSTIGIPIDYISSWPANQLGYNMYTAPVKDIINSQYNRISRNLTGDTNYTALNGQTYGQYDMTKGMWDAAIEMQKRVTNGENTRNVADEMAKERVNPTYKYHSAELLLHPLNDTANYLWTIGAQAKANGDSYTDYYDNEKTKTDIYLKKLEDGWRSRTSLSAQLSNALRGIGGLITSQTEDPDEQKQAVVIPSEK